MSKPKKHWILLAEFPAEYAFNLENYLEAAIGTRSGSGMGFGLRDIDWWYKTEKKAKASMKILAKIMKQRKIKEYNLSVSCFVDD